MEIRFNAKHAARLVGLCRNVEDARYLIENSAVIGAIDALVTRDGECGQRDAATLREELARNEQLAVSLEEIERARGWLAELGRLSAVRARGDEG